MSSVSTRNAPRLNVTDPGFAITSDQVKNARDQSWFAETEYGLAVLRYEEMKALLRHPKLRQGSAAWPAHNGVTEGPLAHWWASWVLNKEGGDHRRLRRLMNPAFAPKLINTLVPRFQALAGELVDAFADRGSCEFMSEFAEPYAARVIAIMLGLPEDEWEIIAAESTTIGLAMGVTLKQDLPQIEAALARLHDYADAAIEARIAEPRDDFVTKLIQSGSGDDKLSRDELRDVIALLIFGGYDTTRNQLGLAMQTFARNPDQWDILAERPDLGGAAVEEVMRINPTVRWVTREAIEDFEYEGLEIKAGTTVHLLSESAGTDPRVFGDAEFDITAERQPHFGFGGGIHHCVGHFVARCDMSEALPLLARRLGRFRIEDSATWLPDSGNTGPVSLPLTFSSAH
ncbi:cytochrome P450 [Gordonia sp. KTR9]|uniref:cytochrome P450 n=1 Tax=Gordonia sp. KTR9 TaxID=337191 RepID=UPI0001DD94DC|nr:cytochrome P450 [Gordonia sp. KTR9]ADK69003.1 Cytochrome P450 [Gordonia sp. KTR9]